MRLGLRNTLLLRVAAIAMIAASAGACSSLPEMPTVPDWVDPTTWFGDDSAPDSGRTPDLASLPDKPAATPPDEQQELSEALAADRTNAKYSADTLRGGTEAAAAPPPVVARTPVASDDESEASSRSAAAPAPAPTRVASVDRSIARDPSGSAMAGTLPLTAPGGYAEVPPPEPVQTAALPEPAPAPEAAPVMPADEAAPAAPAPKPRKPRHTTPTAVASAEPTGYPPVGAQPAVPPSAPMPPQMAYVSPSDAALGFKPSSAPPLDPTVSQFVAAPIIDHYRQTAANAGVMLNSGVPVRVASVQAPARKLRRPSTGVAMGGPEHMTGAVVANLDALTPTTAPVAASPSAYANAQGLPATAVVFFPGDGTRLNAQGKMQVQAIVEQYRSRGAQGYIRIVGHSSSRTVDMSPEQHMDIIFRKSQDRADAVAQELIREGVPANKVLVEAVGDTQPVYYESMPKGEEGNRRAEIFLQS